MLKPTAVAILGGSPVIGKALESLLRSADYVARFFTEYREDDADPLGGAEVALVLPAPSTAHQEALITLIKSTPATTNLPVIALITTLDDGEDGRVTRVPWPCGIEVLRRFIDETLPGDPLDAPPPPGRDQSNPRQ